MNKQIQLEFIKYAFDWNDLTEKQQRLYLKKHPKSKYKFTAKRDSEGHQAVNLLSSIIKKSPFKNKVYVTGGFVRDAILGKESKDVDLVVASENGGIELANYLSQKLNIREPVIFEVFGTAKIQLPTGHEVELVQTRTEEYMRGSRKPQTSYGTLKDDVERRDFTINTLLLDLTTGKVVDETGRGLADLKAGIIRTPLDPNVTFNDDALRMMRAIRFATKYNFKFADDIIPAIKKNADKLFDNTSAERVHEELDKILMTKRPSQGLELLKDTGLMKQIIPELLDLVGLEQGKYHYTDAWRHTLHAVDSTKPILINRLAALFHDIGKPQTKTEKDEEIKGELQHVVHFYDHHVKSGEMAREIMKRLKYSTQQTEDVANLASLHMRGLGHRSWKKPAIRRFIRDTGVLLPNVLDLMKADKLAHDPQYSSTASLEQLAKRIEQIQTEKPVSTKLPISGHQIMQTLDLKQGPEVGKAQNFLSEKLLENPDMTEEDAIKYLKEEF